MATSLYIASLEPSSGKSVVALGLMEILSRRVDRLGYFRPVIPVDDVDDDDRIALVDGRYDLGFARERLFGLRDAEVQRLRAEGEAEEVVKRIVEAYHELRDDCDVVLIDGTDYSGAAAALEFEFNAEVANNLGAPVVAIVNGAGKSVEDVVGAARVARESLVEEGCTLAVTIVNRVRADDVEAVVAALDEELAGEEPAYVLPEIPLLAQPTLGEIREALACEAEVAEEHDLFRPVATTKVAAMSLPNFLEHLEDGALVIVPGDRSDVILGSSVSRMSAERGNIAGIVMTGGLRPEPSVQALIDGLPGPRAPLMHVDTDTYEAARRVDDVRAVIRAEDERKVATSLGVFEEHVDVPELVRRIEVARSDRVTPLMFEYELIERARADRQRIVLPEGNDDRILRAAQILMQRNVVDVVLLGEPDAVRSRAGALSIDVRGATIIDPATSEDLDAYAAAYHEARSHKGITEDQARDAMSDVSYFGTMMVQQGDVDGMVSGAAHTTAHTIRPAFEFVRAQPDVAVVSSVFFMCLPDRVLVYGDCAINPNPDAEELADIAISSARTAETFGIEPRVAMLSYSTGTSGSGADVEAVKEATAIARRRRSDLEIEGPIQYDAAADASVARSKLPDSAVAGRATVFIFPDLNTGNNTYKAVQRSAGAVAIGPILQGLNKPINDLSRGATVDDIVNTVAITAIQAQEADTA